MKNRIERLQKLLRNSDMDAMLVSDPISIFYLTGAKIQPFERMWMLLVFADGRSVLFANKLFVFEDTGLETVWHTDSDDAPAILCGRLDGIRSLGVDRGVQAKYLIPVIHRFPELALEVSSAVEDLRIVKDSEELDRMRKSSRINDAVIEEAYAQLRLGMTEKDLADIINKGYLAHGSNGFCFGTIVAFGKNAADPHHEPDGTVLKDDSAVLIDMGCYYEDYCSDMTRTRFVGNVSEREKLVYETVLEATEKAKAVIRPGTRFCDIDAAARNHIAAAGFGEYFTHRLGHCIGLGEHEPQDVGPVNTNPVREGMVFSIEPGIYLPGEFGVRIEDLVIVTADGYECLNAAPRDLKSIKL